MCLHLLKLNETYGTAHIQVYKKMHVTHRALRNFKDNLHVGLMQHNEYTT